MKYDIYKGTKEDSEGSGGELIQPACDNFQVKAFCKKHEIINPDVLLDGNYIIAGKNGYWLEEAM
jgi:hypothetical protein